jgi:hypothetical protein
MNTSFWPSATVSQISAFRYHHQNMREGHGKRTS